MNKNIRIFILALLCSACSTSPFKTHDVKRLLTYEEGVILEKSYDSSQCDNNVYAPLLLSIRDRQWRPKKSMGSICDLSNAIKWVDSKPCESDSNRTTIEEEFKLFHGSDLQEVCAVNVSPESKNQALSLSSQYNMVELMNAAASCDAVRYNFIEVTAGKVQTKDYQTMSTLIRMCKNQKESKATN